MQATHSKKRVRAALITGIIAVVICAVGVLILAYTLMRPGEPRWKYVDPETATAAAESIANEMPEPALRRWLVDTRGIDLPADCVSATYAFAETADIARSVFGASPYERAYAVLRTDWHMDPTFYDTLDDLYWDVMMETSEGDVNVFINARTGEDFAASMVPADLIPSDSWDFFEEWAERGDDAPPTDRWGTVADEEGWAETKQELLERAKTEPKGRNAYQRQRIAEMAADPANASYADEALRLANEGNMGNGAQAVSAAVCLEGDRTYLVDVELSDGSYLVLHLFQESPSNVQAYERHNTSLLDILYPL